MDTINEKGGKGKYDSMVNELALELETCRPLASAVKDQVTSTIFLECIYKDGNAYMLKNNENRNTHAGT